MNTVTTTKSKKNLKKMKEESQDYNTDTSGLIRKKTVQLA